MKKILFIFLISISATTFTQWQPDVRLTYDPAQSSMSVQNKHCIASSGNVLHVVWHDERNTNWDIYYKRSFNAGLSWGTDFQLSHGAGISQDASVAVTGSVVHVAWQDTRDGNPEIYYIRSTDNGISWGIETRLTANAFESSNVCVAVSGLAVHIVWIDTRNGNYEIYYKRSTDGGINWGPDIRMTNNPANSWFPSISAVGAYLHVVWYDGRDGNNEIYYKRSTDGGISWGADTRLSSTPYISEVTTTAAYGSSVHVVWQDERDGNREIYYKRSTDNGTNWGIDTRLTNNAAESGAPNITVSGMNLHVTWQDTRDGNLEVYYKRSTDGGLSWGSDTRLTNSPGSSVRTFSTVTGTALHIVWMDERDGNWEIYYKQNPTGNPLPIPPLPPNLISPPNGSYNEPLSVRFIWNRPLLALTYRMQLALDSLFTNIVYDDSTLTDSTIVVVNLTANRYYWWHVNAKNTYGTSQYSDVWKFGTFPVGVKEIGKNIPNKFELFQNYPNPFNPVSKIKFDLAKAGNARLIIYDIQGKEVTVLVNKYLHPGTYETEFDGSNFPSGVYFYKMETETFTTVKKMVLLK